VSPAVELRGIDSPVVQAGMGGGLARHDLAAAVSEAGGLGTLGILDSEALRRELAAARRLTDRPIAINLLLPFARREQFEVAADADALFTFWGRPRRHTAGLWVHQCGSVQEALEARAAGADAVIAQGVEAGGHVRGTEPALDLLERVRHAVGPTYPVLLAGGIADRDDVRTALDAGATAAVLGTRFLMTDESRAHPAYKQRLMESRETVLTELFGAGWAGATHRVLWNEAAERWLTSDHRGPAAVRAANRALSPALARLPYKMQDAVSRFQRASLPLLGPVAPTDDGPRNLLDAGPLYAGESVARIYDVLPAAEVVRALTP
jgi:NAD(P)H-dependent flavin oxidoreductase YrpB (nitropropane dioxygenase family)